MNRLAKMLAVVVGVSATHLAVAQESATPAAPPAKAQPAPAKPKLYDESADAKQQIAAALAKAKKENRRVLIQWGGNWCGWCIKLDECCKNDKAVRGTLRAEYDVVHVDAGREGKNMDLAKSYGADIDGFPYLTILDSNGKPIVNQSTPAFEVDGKDLKAGHDMVKFNEFLTKHKATALNAQDVLDQGFSAAKREGKRVFLHFGAPWCGWCHRMEAWMARPEISSVLAKDFVDVKIDIDRMTGGKDVMKKYTQGQEGGIPWYAMLDDSGKALADSGLGEKNVGFPYKPEEVKHFVEMLKKSVRSITPGEIDSLAASLNADREAEEAKKAPKSGG